GGAFTLYAFRASAMEAKGIFSTVSRESGLVLNNILLAVSSFVVFIGTIWPLVAEMFWGRTVSVGPPFFNAAFTPFAFAIAVALPIGAVLPWKRAQLGRAMRLMSGVALLTIALLGLFYALGTGRSLAGLITLALGVWLVAGAAVDLWQRTGQGREIAAKFGRLTRLPRADWGKAVAHAGLGITFIGVGALVTYQIEDIRVAQIGEEFDVGAYHLTVRDVREVQGPNYISTMAFVEVAKDGRIVDVLTPEKRIYPVAGMPTTEAGIDSGFTRDVYVALGDPQLDGGWAVRTWIKPFANWIWGGAIIMALGGALSLTDRRYRVAAGAARDRAAVGVPAE
ncbi:MAG: cytochrome c-type biogenesis CcmF C-terminal domain-containing protein, partial [Paracoccaceae bacterium]